MMNIKDIVNRDLVNLSNCEQEPIHVPGSIQTHGFLMGVDTATMAIRYCSGNTSGFTGLDHRQCLGKTFADIFGAGTEQAFMAYAQRKAYAINPPMELEVNGNMLLCSVHRAVGLYIAEFEPTDPNATDIATVYNQTIQFVGFMEQSETLQELCSRVAEQTRAITGYDRVMVYRFDKDYNGEVYAESKVDSIEPFLGLHYPHTDIPVQARRLYLTNLMRIITDINYVPVPIYTIDDGDHTSLDLSNSYLRSVSPIHVQYLQNMGVGGTLTISLIHDGRLWGLITCHHYSSKYVPLYTRIAAQMQGHFLTSQINVRQLNEEYKTGAEINASLEQLLDKKHEPRPGSFEDIIADPALLSLCGAGGVAILFGGKVFRQGNTPTEEQIIKLAYWLNTYTRHKDFFTSRLADVYPDAEQFAATGAGIIYHSLSGAQEEGIIWFAPETKEEVNWAGNPDDAIQHTEKGLSPRNSFQLWKQILKNESRAWGKPGLLATATYAHALQKHITLIMISEEEKNQRILTQKLQEANTELENINWISSHDLKEPLRKIQVFSSKIIDKEGNVLSDMATLSLTKVMSSASRMQQLLADITEYNKVRHLDTTYEAVDLNKVMQHVAGELKDELAEKGAELTYGSLPVINGVTFLLRQLFINLLRNSLKFERKDVPLRISVAPGGDMAMVDNEPQQYYKIDVKDNGIGFDNEHAESIFKVFTRLHGVLQYEGSGIGLALCRKIMQNHKGFINASGVPGEGAVFSLYFPVP